jgi:hypothetical protein
LILVWITHLSHLSLIAMSKRRGNSSEETNITQLSDTGNQSSTTSQPILWTPSDRPGRNGHRDRHNRRARLMRSIKLSAEQLRDILLFMYEHEEWTPEVLHRYIPRTFETAVITQGIAEGVLYDAVSRAFNDLFAS